MATRRRGAVAWKAEEVRVPVLPPHPYSGDNAGEDRWASSLVPGSLWQVKSPLTPNHPRMGCKQHPFSYLGHGLTSKSLLSTVAVYLGTVRVEEAMYVAGKPKLTGILRHCFLIDGVRYMVLNLGWLRPVDSKESV